MTDNTQPDNSIDSQAVEKARRWIAQEKRNLIGGAWQPALGGETIPTPDPATGDVIANVPRSGKEDVDAAVKAARRAFEAVWQRMDPYEREGHLLAIADLIERNEDELAAIQSLDMGALISTSRMLVASAVTAFRYYAGWVTKIGGLTLPMRGDQITYTRREALGVVGAIIPWNGPALASAWKIAPALACGNTVVFKPANEAPLVSLRMAELMLEAGLPEGVLNMVTGGGDAGEAMVAHPDINKITFTGSVKTGQSIMRSAADDLKKVTLELGGKSPTIIMADADLDIAIPGALMGFTAGAGQGCVAGTRILVHENIAPQVADALAQQVKALKVGSAFDETTQIPPIVSQAQLEKVEGYIRAGSEQGATPHAKERSRQQQQGFYAMPTLFTNVNSNMTIVREEIFGPVATLTSFRSEEDAVAEANNTTFGLAANIWTRDLGTAHRVSDRIQSGIVWVNTLFELDHMAPFGGYKMSGIGRELGAESIEAFTQTKTVVMRY